MITARMRHGNAWSDASILNISSRGLLLHAAAPPSRGTYVEVRRGAHVIVGRVIWAKSDRFGIRAQDRLVIDSLISNASRDHRPANDTGGASPERRARPRADRLEWRHAQSREKGRALQSLCIAGFGMVLAAYAYEAVSGTLSNPMTRIALHLGGTP